MGHFEQLAQRYSASYQLPHHLPDHCVLYIQVSRLNLINLDSLAHIRIARLGALGYVLASTIFETAPTGNCARFEKVVDWLFPVAVSFTSLLFFFRVRAIFDNNKYVVAFFAFMWLFVLAGCLTVTQGVTGAHIGPTNYCINASLQDYVQAAAIIPLVNDTLVFLAISWRLVLNSHLDNTLKDGARMLFFGVHMPAFSRSLLQDGQVYYLYALHSSLSHTQKS